MALFKDLTGTSYNDLHKIDFCASYGNTSVQKNVDNLREVFREWAESVITLSDAHSWNVAARNAALPEAVKNANLWLDSVDFAIKKEKDRRGVKSDYHSYKLNGPGMRYWVLQDAKGQILKIWVGVGQILSGCVV